MRPVVVLGSLNMDLTLAVGRLPAPGETVLGGGLRTTPGGKGANQAVAARRLGAPARMVGRVGDDGFGQTLRAGLAAEGIASDTVTVDPERPTGVALILVDPKGENQIAVAPGANG
ncbi:MAG TPA: PfkB family carbohydrate kinase, partial [Candidatus Dormibacteraeota bacterium]|nr:PfkB family carbohydrate kinase [Candidatus Dormibacteraeota bacterium]